MWSPRTHTGEIQVTLAVSTREVASRDAPWITIRDVDKTPILQASTSAQDMGNQELRVSMMTPGALSPAIPTDY